VGAEDTDAADEPSRENECEDGQDDDEGREHQGKPIGRVSGLSVGGRIDIIQCGFMGSFIPFRYQAL
jgi:hypothetical protein